MANDDSKLSATATDPELEKGSTKTFTQSETDSLIARERKKLESKYEGYDTLKTEIETLKKEKDEREMKELSEIDKLKKQLANISGERESLGTKVKTYQLKEKKQAILSDPKYKDLPLVYRDAVTADDDEFIVKESADKILEQFQIDMKSLGKKSDTFGLSQKSEPPIVNNLPKNLAQAVSQKWKNLHSS